MAHTPTLAVNGSFVHSKYNPQEEARRILDSEFFQTAEVQSRCIFTGLGLGYLASQYIERFPAAEAVIIEADMNIFLCCLAARRLDSLFRHRHLSLLIGTQPEEAASFLASTGWNSKILFKEPVSTEAYKPWYGTFFMLLERNKMKNSINAKTLERFGTLWLKNTVKNLDMLCTAAKIGCFKNAFPDTAYDAEFLPAGDKGRLWAARKPPLQETSAKGSHAFCHQPSPFPVKYLKVF